MRITFLGTGSASTYGDGNWQSNLVIESDGGKRMLLDCGSDIRFSMGEVGLLPSDIDAVFISHCHADHIGGMEHLGFATYFSKLPRPKLFIHGKMGHDLWDHSLKGGMRSLEGEIACLKTFFDVQAIRKNGFFTWEGVNFQLVQVVHMMDGFDIVPSYGLLFTVNDKTVFWTSDTQFAAKQFDKFYARADIILQDCETTPYKSGVHAHYTELLNLPAQTRAKMWLYHYSPGEKPDAAADGFAGWAVKGQSFET